MDEVNTPKTEKRFKILCIDGGGIKGLYSAELLAQLEESYGILLSDYFDLICGTSTGGIMALAISLRIPMRNISSFYEQYGPEIFNERFKKRPFGNIILFLKQVAWRGKYNDRLLKQHLESVFGNRKIGESNNLLCIQGYDLISGRPRVFKKDYNKFNTDDSLNYVDVALATSAAPTFFPIHVLNDSYYVDGGVWANNPSMVGLTEYFREFAGKGYNGADILSISSLIQPTGLVPGRAKKSFIQWNSKLFDLFTSSQNYFADFFLKILSNSDVHPIVYTRIVNKQLSKEQLKIIDMDKANSKALALLKTIGKSTAVCCKNDVVLANFFNEPKTYITDKKN